MDLFILEEADYINWLDALVYELSESYGSSSTKYLSAANMAEGFSGQFLKVSVEPSELVGDIICRVTGKRPRFYTEHEIDARLSQDYGRRALVSKATYLSSTAPTLSLVCPLGLSVHRRWRTLEINYKKSVGEIDLSGNNVLLLRRTSVDDLLRKASNSFQGNGGSACARFIQDRTEFLDFISTWDHQNQSFGEKKKNGFSRYTGADAEKLIFLYTEEDSEVASYVRTHFDALDRASDRTCELLVIERPSAVVSRRFWRERLSERLCILWNLVGFADSLPYNKAECYDIARSLGLRPSDLPCAVRLSSTAKNKVSEVISLTGNLTATFRSIFSGFEPDTRPPDRYAATTRLGISEGTLCFLSHNSNDKSLVKAVATRLHAAGLETWLDCWEICPGDSIPEKISHGLGQATHIAVFLSQAGLGSRWVREEMNAGLYKAISDGHARVIPILLEPCDVPALIASYARIDVGRSIDHVAEALQAAILHRTDKPAVVHIV